MLHLYQTHWIFWKVIDGQREMSESYSKWDSNTQSLDSSNFFLNNTLYRLVFSYEAEGQIWGGKKHQNIILYPFTSEVMSSTVYSKYTLCPKLFLCTAYIAFTHNFHLECSWKYAKAQHEYETKYTRRLEVQFCVLTQSKQLFKDCKTSHYTAFIFQVDHTYRAYSARGNLKTSNTSLFFIK